MIQDIIPCKYYEQYLDMYSLYTCIPCIAGPFRGGPRIFGLHEF